MDGMVVKMSDGLKEFYGDDVPPVPAAEDAAKPDAYVYPPEVKAAIARYEAQLAALAQAPAPVRVLMDELAESRKYALALEEELRARTERLDQLLLLANSMDADFQSYAEAHPASLRITGPNSDGEYWLHIKAGGRDGGINLGVDHGPICKRLLDAATETGAKK